MPKPYTFPTIFDEVLQISITKLKQWGYLDPEQFKSGTLNWSYNGEKTASISIIVNTYNPLPYIKLDYKSNGNPISYKINLVSIPSNLGIGKIWYFRCPHTFKRCRKLYSISDYFLHRTALPNGMYDCQTKSKKWRGIEKVYGAYFDLDSLYEEIYCKHFKKTYAGKPTKRYLKIMNQINRAERLTTSEVENLF